MLFGIGEMLLLSFLASLIVGRSDEAEDEHGPGDGGLSKLHVFVLTFLALLGVNMVCWAIINHPVILSPGGMLILTMAAMVIAASGIGRQIGGAVQALNEWLRTIDDTLFRK